MRNFFTAKNLWQQDITFKERTKAGMKTAGMIGITAWLYYRRVWAVIFLILPGIWLYREFLEEESKKKEQEFQKQFREMIQTLSSALNTGYSVENAFIASVRDLEEQYGKEGMITREFSYLASQLKMNRTVEALLSSFAKRSGLDEVENFSVIFTVSKRSRGELASVVHHVVHVISDRIQVREEILTMTAEKQFEQKIMNLMPYLIVLYVDLSSPGFFSQMYETAVGRVVMTGCLVVYLLAWRVSGKILQIEV